MKLGFLFLTIENVYHPDIWEEFFGAEVDERCIVRMHPKPESVDLIRAEWRPRVVADPVPTRWGEVSLVVAMNRLLRSALEDEEVERFVLLSDSTIPIRSFDQVYERLAAETRSIFAYASDPELWPRCEPLLEYLPRSVVAKSHQWAVLNRKHAQLLVDHEAECLGWFTDVFAADEHVWITMLHHWGLENEVVDGLTTYVEWPGGNLRAFDRLSGSDIETILASECLFARKFPPGSNARRLWRRVDGGSGRVRSRDPVKTPRESIWLFGDGRSGTSWLSNMINYDERLSYYFEPFHFQDRELSRRVEGLHRLKYMPVALQDPALEEVVDEILDGRFGTSWTTRPPSRPGVLVKDIYANLLMAWMHERYPSTKKVMLIRHPFAVACSKRRLHGHQGWRFVHRPSDIFMHYDLRHDFLGPVEELFAEVEEGFQEHVLAWAVNYYVPLRQLRLEDVHVVFYEELLENPQPTLDALFVYLYGEERKRHRWPAPRVAFEAPSRSTRGSTVFSPDAWKSMVTPSEERAGRDILWRFGLEGLYQEDGSPSRSAVDAMLRGEGPKPRQQEGEDGVLWLAATALERGGRYILLVGAVAERCALGRALEGRGWSAGRDLTALDRTDLSVRSPRRLDARGNSAPIEAVFFLSRCSEEKVAVPLGPGEATIQLATALLDVDQGAGSAIDVLGGLATTIEAFRLSYARADAGASQLESGLADPGLVNGRS